MNGPASSIEGVAAGGSRLGVVLVAMVGWRIAVCSRKWRSGRDMSV